MNICKTLGLSTVIAVCASVVAAAPISYDFTWTGSSNITMVGFFTGEDQNADDVISDGEVSFLSFEGFNNGVSIGSNSGDSVSLAGSFGFDFTFNILTATFNDSGTSGVNGQLWNIDGPGLGFYDGNASAALRINGVGDFGNTSDPQSYTATLRAPNVVPLPAGLPLMIGALGILGLVRSRRSRQA